MHSTLVPATLLLLTVSCGGPRVTTPSDLPVVASGMTRIAGGASVGMIFENVRAMDALDVAIRLEFLDPRGERIGVADDRISYCPAAARCPWGSTYTAFGRAAGVRVRASVGSWEPRTRRVVPVEVSRVPGSGVVARTPGPEGRLAAVAFSAGAPVAGAGIWIEAGSRTVAIPEDLLPATGEESLLGVLYPQPLPAHD